MVIATPGRLNDLMEFHCQDGSSVLTLSSTRVLVLDEADRMCDMGFEDAIKTVGVIMKDSIINQPGYVC